MSWGTPIARGHVFNTTNGATLAIGSVAFTSGRLYVSFYTSEGTGGIYDHSTMAITGQTGSWTFIVQTTNGIGANARRISAWYYVATASETVTVTYDPPSGSKACHAASIIEVPSGFDSTTPIANNNQAEDTTGGATFACNLSSAPSASNMSMVGVVNRNNSFAIGVDGAFTELTDDVGSGTSTDSGDLEVSYKTAATQNCTVSAGSGTPVWGGIHLELAAASASSSATDTESGTLADSSAPSAAVIPIETAALSEVRSVTAATVNSDAASLTDAAVANLTQNVADTDTLTVTDALSALGIAGVPSESLTLAESAANTVAASTTDAGTLADASLASIAHTTTDAAVLSEATAIGAASVTADAGALSETETASQAGTGGGPATDTESAQFIEQAIAELIASTTDTLGLTDSPASLGTISALDTGVVVDSTEPWLNATDVDAGLLTEASVASGPPVPPGVDSDAFVFSDDAVVTYRFPPPRRGTRLHRHGGGTYLHQQQPIR